MNRTYHIFSHHHIFVKIYAKYPPVRFLFFVYSSETGNISFWHSFHFLLRLFLLYKSSFILCKRFSTETAAKFLSNKKTDVSKRFAPETFCPNKVKL